MGWERGGSVAGVTKGPLVQRCVRVEVTRIARRGGARAQEGALGVPLWASARVAWPSDKSGKWVNQGLKACGQAMCSIVTGGIDEAGLVGCVWVTGVAHLGLERVSDVGE